MKLNDRVYDFLKWFALIFLPALAILVSVVMPAWNFGADYVKPIVITLNAIGVFIGTLIGISQASIAQENAQETFAEETSDDEIEVAPDENNDEGI